MKNINALLLAAGTLGSLLTVPAQAELVRMAPRTSAAVVLGHLRPMASSTLIESATSVALVRMEERARTESVALALHRMVKDHEDRETAVALLRPMERGRDLTVARQVTLVRMEPLAEGTAGPVKLARMVEMVPTALAQNTAEAPALPVRAGRAAVSYPLEGQAFATGDAGGVATVGKAQETLAATPTPAVEGQAVASTAAKDELLLEFNLDGQRRGDILSARQDAETGKVYLPLAAMVQGLGFPITVDARTGVAQGWFVSEDRTFALNEIDGYVEIGGVRQSLPRGAVRREGDDIFVDEAVLKGWFPLQLDVSMNELAVNARSTEILPEKARLARQEIWRQREQVAKLPEGPLHELTQAMFGWPSVKADVGTAYSENQGRDSLMKTLGLQAQGNMLGMDGYVALGFQDSDANNRTFTGGTLRLTRDEISGTLMGPLAATHMELGDVRLPVTSLLGSTGSGQGLSFNNKPKQFAGSVDDFSLRGEAPAGWDVEVYQNDALMAFGAVGNDGRYTFDDVNLRPGLNDFKIVLYGPRGEKREQTQSYYIGEGLVKPGEWIYEAGVTRSKMPLLTSQRNTDDGAGTLVLNSFYGVNRNLSLNLGVAQGPLGSEDNIGTGATAGIRAAFGRSFTQANVAGFSDGGYGLSVRESLRVGKNGELGAFYTRNASSTLGSSQPVNEHGVQAADTFKLADIPVRLGLVYSQQHYARDRDDESLLQTTQNWRLGKVAFNHSLSRRFTDLGDRWEDGQLDVATRVNGLPLQGDLQYVPDMQDVVRSVAVSSYYDTDDRTTLRVRGQYQPPEDITSVNASLKRDIGKLALGVQGTWQSNDTYQVGVNLGVQLASDGAEPDWRMVPANSESFGYGSADLLVYEDDNMNGVMDPGEQPVPGVKIANARNGTEVTTNEQGIARVNKLLPQADTLVRIDEASLPDVYLKAKDEWHTLRAKPGYGGKVALPLVRHGEIAGVLASESAMDFAHVNMWLVDARGKVVERTQPADDGSFYFSSVPIGTYTVHARSTDGRMGAQNKVVLTKAEPVLSEVKVKLP